MIITPGEIRETTKGKMKMETFNITMVAIGFVLCVLIIATQKGKV